MLQTTSVRVHLFHGTRLLATLAAPVAKAEPYYTLDDGTLLQAISYLTVTHLDGTPGLDVQVVPANQAPRRTPRAGRPPHGRSDHRA